MYLRVFLLSLFLLLAIPAITIIIGDPYQVWHNRWIGEDAFSSNQRYQNAGLIRRYLECADCDAAAVIIGTSVSENTTLTDLRETTGLNNAVRLIAKGSYPAEHSHMLRRALDSGKVKVVFWEIYRNYVGPKYAHIPPPQSAFPIHLYSSTLQDDYKYLLNHDVFVDAVLLALGQQHWDHDAESLNSWHDKAIKGNRYQTWNDPDILSRLTELKAKNAPKWIGKQPDWSQPTPVFEQFILPLVDNYPEVQFLFFTPPVSLQRHAQDIGDSLSAQLALRKRLAALADSAPNVSVYVFDDYAPLVSDQAYYKDAGHYTKTVNRWILERIMAEDQRFLLTSENVLERGNRLWEMTANYMPYSSCTHSLADCGRFNSNLIQ